MNRTRALALVVVVIVVAIVWVAVSDAPHQQVHREPRTSESARASAIEDVRTTPIEDARTNSVEDRELSDEVDRVDKVGEVAAETTQNDEADFESDEQPRLEELHIWGRVVDPDGNAVRAMVEARSGDGRVARSNLTDSEEPVGGKFDVKVLGAGPFVVTALGMGVLFDESAPMELRAPMGDVTLRLRRPSTIFGDVVDLATGLPHQAEVRFTNGASLLSSANGEWSGGCSVRQGRWSTTVPAHGTFAFSARSEDGAWAVASGVVVEPETEVGPIRLALRPCAKLVVSYRGLAKIVHVDAKVGGVVVVNAGFSPQRGFEGDVPACELEVVLSDARETWRQTKAIVPEPGQRVELVFD